LELKVFRADIVSSPKEAIGFCGDRIRPGEWGWTWPGRLGELLRQLESRYGPRHKEWTPLGIQFGGRVSGLFYPGDPAAKQVSIRLSDDCRTQQAKCLFALAHEAVHLLAPSGGTTNLIEEGLATNFSREIGQRFALGFSEASPAYIYARDLTADFLAKYSAQIREIRRIEPSFVRFTPNLVRSICEGITTNLAEQLCEPFPAVEARLGGPLRD
jgi:hypothetical protein